jgi:hypothetical protein
MIDETSEAAVVVDAHVHLFPPEVQARREWFGQRDPFFGYLYGAPRARMVSLERLLADMDRDGVAQAVLAGWPWQHHDLCVEHNTWAMEVIRQWPGRLMALAAIQPAAGAAAVRELYRCVAGGFRGVGELNADGQGFRLSDPEVLAIAQEAGKLHLPLLLHTNEPVGHEYPGKGALSLRDVYRFIRAVPETEIVLAHWGGGLPFYELMPEVRAECAHVYYDSAASPLLYSPAVFRHVVDIVGDRRVLFGSDYPLILQPKRQREPGFAGILDQVRGHGLPEPALARVLGRNALDLFGAAGLAAGGRA